MRLFCNVTITTKVTNDIKITQNGGDLWNNTANGPRFYTYKNILCTLLIPIDRQLEQETRRERTITPTLSATYDNCESPH